MGCLNLVPLIRIPNFLSKFWKVFFDLQEVSLNYNSAYHIQTNGQTEVLNKCLKWYLRSYARAKPKSWAKCLSLAQWSYNTSFQSSLKLSTFEVLYGYPSPKLISYVPGNINNEAADKDLKDREQIKEIVQQNLEEAQNRMKHFEDKKRTERQFEVRDWVYLRLQPDRQKTIAMRHNLKLSLWFYRPIQVTEHLRSVAY